MKPWAKAAVQGATCGLVFGMVVLAGGRLWQPQIAAAQTKPAAVPDVVRARRFQVVDSAGRVRIALTFDSLDPEGWFGSPGLALLDRTGKVRAMLGLYDDGNPGLALADATGKVRAALMVSYGSPTFGLLDAAGKVRVNLRVQAGGSSGLGLLDAAGTARATLEATSDGTPRLGLGNAAGKTIWKAP